MRHDPVASPQDGTPTKQVSDKTKPRNRCGSLWARMHRQDIIKRKKNYSIVYNYTDENGETRQKWETRTSSTKTH